MRSSVQAVLDQEVIAGGKQGQQSGRNSGHAACGDERRFGVFQRRQLAVERLVIGRVVQPDVLDVVVTDSARVLEHRGLKNGHADRAADSRRRLAGMDQLGFEAFELPGHVLMFPPIIAVETKYSTSMWI